MIESLNYFIQIKLERPHETEEVQFHKSSIIHFCDDAIHWKNRNSGMQN
jgi:hypothetical protein